MSIIEDWVHSEAWADGITTALFCIAAAALYFLIKALLPLLSKAAGRSKWNWDDVIADRRLRHRLALLGPAVLIYVGATPSAEGTAAWAEFLRRSSTALVIAATTATISALLGAVNSVYERKPIARDRPIEAYIQIIQILVYLFGTVFVVAVLIDRPPWFFVGGLGALTAVLLLVFRTTILSVVASIELAQADAVDVGDWIEVPAYGADGTVTDVALHTITVQNHDKTITMVPTHELINTSFKNWSGVTEGGRRRIKRKLFIDMQDIRFLTEEEIERFAHFEPLRQYMAEKTAEIAADRMAHPPSHDGTGDPRRLTNIGTLRAYIGSYLRGLDTIDTDDMAFLVRQQEPGPHGLPLEIYSFTTTADPVEYEGIQSDIFDHILAMLPEFGLRVFQEPTGEDVRVPPIEVSSRPEVPV